MSLINNYISTCILISTSSIGFSQTIHKSDIVGLWKIDSFYITNNKGIKNHWAKQVHGTLFYSKGNFMSVSLNGRDKKNNKILFYSGFYDISPGGVIIHHVLNASDLNRINKKMVRKARVESGYLTLTAEADYGTAVLKWKKVTKANSLKSQ